MNTESRVAEHYAKGRLEERILSALKLSGRDVEQLTVFDLAAMDEFHVGGLAATKELADQMELQADLRLLDIGSGVGGPARYFAAEHGCRVTGVDVTEEFVQASVSLTKMLRLDSLVEFKQASALELPLGANLFDRAYMIHVGMNIADKAAVFREVRRVLKSGGLFVVFDVLRASEGPLRYPLPWASDEATSFVATAAGYRDALNEAGFTVEKERSRKAFGIDFTQRSLERMALDGTPTLGLQLLMGDKTPIMISNLLAMMKEGLLEPVELFARARVDNVLENRGLEPFE
jgi:ubiquinone/menaquinone biosynthesis C-methylase UbiE